MPNLESAKKQMRASERRRLRNTAVISRTRTDVRKAEKLIGSGPGDEARAAAATAVSSLDRAAQKGVIHANNAARRKSRLMKKLNQARPKKAAKKPS